MVVERKSKSFVSLACVARGRIAAWENGSRAGHSMSNAMTQLARALDARHAVSTTTISRKVCRGTPVPRRGRPFGRVLLAIQLAR